MFFKNRSLTFSSFSSIIPALILQQQWYVISKSLHYLAYISDPASFQGSFAEPGVLPAAAKVIAHLHCHIFYLCNQIHTCMNSLYVLMA